MHDGRRVPTGPADGSEGIVVLRVSVFTTIIAPLALAGAVQGSIFSTGVVDYTPGDVLADYRNAAASLGKPSEFNPGEPLFDIPPTVLTPFNAAFDPDDIVGIGQGGHLVLELGQTAPTGAGYTLGVHAGVGLTDDDWPNGTIIGSAETYTTARQADVRVSYDGQAWVELGSDVTFDAPTNWWAQGIATPGAEETSGTIEADFARPWLGSLSDFDDSDWQQVLATLDGSAGGTWFDLTAIDLPGVNYVEFTVPDAGESIFIDAVVAIPEPALLAPTLLGLLALRRRRGL